MQLIAEGRRDSSLHCSLLAAVEIFDGFVLMCFYFRVDLMSLCEVTSVTVQEARVGLRGNSLHVFALLMKLCLPNWGRAGRETTQGTFA